MTAAKALKLLRDLLAALGFLTAVAFAGFIYAKATQNDHPPKSHKHTRLCGNGQAR